MNLSYGSVCSGIEAATVAWEPLGWRASWFSQFDPEHDYSRRPDFPSLVLAHHYPTVPNLGDMAKIGTYLDFGDVDPPDVLVGGTPCQAFSLAGLRKGLSDSRGQLTLTYVELANQIDEIRVRDGKEPAIIVWENVPGVLNTKDNAFGCFVGALSGNDEELHPPRKRGVRVKWPDSGCVIGPTRTVAWRVLDAQYVGLAQRRRRVFVVASARERFHPAQVLFEFNGVRRDTPPSREAGESVAGTLASRTDGGGFPGTDESCSGYVQPVAGRSVSYGVRIAQTGSNGVGVQPEIVHTLDRAMGIAVAQSKPVIGFNWNAQIDQTSFDRHVTSPLTCSQGSAVMCMAHGQGGAEIASERCPTLTCNHEAPIIAPIAWSEELTATIDCAGTIQRGGDGGRHDGVMTTDMRVRRLTPVECERLQGFPDGYTDIHQSGNGTPDGPRYKALGNSMAVPVMRWIGRRIEYALTNPWCCGEEL